MDHTHAIGIDLGGTNVKMIAVAADGQILKQERFGTSDDAAAAWIQGIGEHLRAIESELGPTPHVGVAAPGLAGRDGRAIAWMQGRLAALQGLDWTDALQRATKVPILNDAHAALLGEVWQGAARGERNAVLLTLGTGVGGAIICDGHLLRGHLGRAGHLGHICLDIDGAPDIVNTPGSLEDLIGNHSVSQRSGGRFTSTHDLVAAYVSGDPQARDLWLRSVRALACGIVSIINAVDPAVIIIGGGIAQAGPALFEPLAEQMDAFEWRPRPEDRVRIVPATLGPFAGAMGAAYNAIQQDSTDAHA